jgi:carbon monoxide dehydrogenase subunit G
MKITLTLEIQCFPDRLWPFLEEPEQQKRWMRGLQENTLTSPPPSRKGSTFTMKIKEGARVAEYQGEVTAHDRPRHLGVRIWGGALKPGMAMRADYRLTDLGQGTQLDYECNLEAERLGFFMKLFLPLFKVFGKLQVKSFFKTLKRISEAPEG